MDVRSLQPSRPLSCEMVFAIVCLACHANLLAQCEIQKLTALDAARNMLFGESVSVDGDVAVVGARNLGCASGIACGAVHVYQRAGANWVERHKLTPFDYGGLEYFPTFASVSGNVILVGANLQDCNVGPDCGAAYVFRYDGSTWVREQKLRAFVQAAGNLFGSSVAVSGDLAVMGAPGEDCAAGTDCGAAYVYRFNGSWWEQEQELAALNPAAGDRFGGAVAVSGNVVIVGAIGRDDCAMGSNCGAALVYQFNGVTWVLQQELTASDSKLGARFGGSVFVSGNIAIAGADHADCSRYPRCGAAYVYRFDGSAWIEEQKLTASDGGPEESFGYSVSASGDDVLLVGAPGAYYNGAAYVFRFDGSLWIEVEKLVGSPHYSGAHAGQSVSLTENLAFAGAPLYDYPRENQGAVYLYAIGPDCNANGEADFCDIRDGNSGDTDSDGVPDECEVITAALDIRPGACPNPFNPKSRGVLPVVVVGTESFDVTEIDNASLLLLRPTSHGGRVRPLSDPPGHGPRFADTVTFLDAPPCECPPQGPDGFDDLILKFSISEMVEALDLDAPGPGDSVMLTLTGVLNDGMPFAASDCILITGGRATPLPAGTAGRPSDAASVGSAHSSPDATATPVGRIPPKD